MNLRKQITTIFLAMLIVTMTACAGVMPESTATVEAGQAVVSAIASHVDVDYDSEDISLNISLYPLSYISLEGGSITTAGSGMEVNGSAVTILAPGAYSISGALNDGQIIVDTQEDGTVVLILNGANINSSTNAPIYIRNAEKVILHLAKGTENFVADGASYVFEEAGADEPNAAIFSADDLVINGSGSLTVNANYNNGIVSKDDLKITGGRITVNASNDAIKGKDYVAILDGTITINAGGDGLQSHNDTDAEKGYIVIEGGIFDITAGADGIQAETRLLITGGQFTIVTAGGSVNGTSAQVQQGPGDWGLGNIQNEDDTTPSAKGLKAGVEIVIAGGEFDIDSMEDAVHSNASLTVSGGELRITAGDDALHADNSLLISGGNLTIAKSYEGLESQNITISGGSIRLTASDDGVNASSGNGSGQDMMTSDSRLSIHGGYLYVDANGDGIDANGPITMTAGTVIVNGPTNNGNGAVDYLGEFTVTGGFLVAVGSSGMAQAPGETSSQYSILYGFDSSQPADSILHIESAAGENILTFAPTKAYQSVVISSPALGNGSYTLYVGGVSSGTAADGLYSGGTYSGGIQVASINVTSVVTYAGSVGGGMFPGGQPGGNPGVRPPRP